MTEIYAIVRRGAAAATRQALERIGCAGYTAFPVLGRGRQRGAGEAGDGPALPFVPKMLFLLAVDDASVDDTVGTILRANQTGAAGDGKVFVVPAADAYRISTGEREGVRAQEVAG